MNSMKTRISIAYLFLGLLFVSSSARAQGYTYTFTGVYTPPGDSSAVNGVDALGDAVGLITTPSGASYAYLWTSSGMAINLGSSANTSSGSVAYSITYDSHYYYVVGQAPNAGYYNFQQAYLWKIDRSTYAATATDIQGITANGSGFSCAYKVTLINGAWEAVGKYNPAVNHGNYSIITEPIEPFLWASGSANKIVSKPTGVTPHSINSSGTIVGTYMTSPPYGFGEVTQGFDLTLGAFLGTGTGALSRTGDPCQAFDINNGGYAVGQWDYESNGNQSYVWNPVSGFYSLLGGYSGNAIDNETYNPATAKYHSQIVGDSFVSNNFRATVWDSVTSSMTPSYPTSPTDLNSLVQTIYTEGNPPVQVTITLADATSISDAPSGHSLGYIGGTYTSTAFSGTEGFILSPDS